MTRARSRAGRAALPGLVVLALAALALPARHAAATKARPTLSPKLIEIVVVAHGPRGAAIEKPIIAGGGELFRDCAAAPERTDHSECPALVLVPSTRPGQMIGSPVGEDGRGPDEELQSVEIPAFAIGQAEITGAEFARCTAAGACRALPPASPDLPVTGVTFADATAYAAWLAATTAQPYRLPSEAEWEYAARGGTSAPAWWQEAPPSRADAAAAVCAGCGGAGTPRTSPRAPMPAAAVEPNPWGIVNASGNVWEWTADVYCERAVASPRDGSPRLSAACADAEPSGKYVVRGGSFRDQPALVRSAARQGRPADATAANLGFRVARDVQPRR